MNRKHRQCKFFRIQKCRQVSNPIRAMDGRQSLTRHTNQILQKKCILGKSSYVLVTHHNGYYMLQVYLVLRRNLGKEHANQENTRQTEVYIGTSRPASGVGVFVDRSSMKILNGAKVVYKMGSSVVRIQGTEFLHLQEYKQKWIYSTLFTIK